MEENSLACGRVEIRIQRENKVGDVGSQIKEDLLRDINQHLRDPQVIGSIDGSQPKPYFVLTLPF